METLGAGGFSDRRLHLIEVPDIDGLGEIEVQFPERCAALLAWNATEASDESIALAGEMLLDAGAVSLCSWGDDCQRVHEVFNRVLEGPDPPATAFPDLVMTTWHAREPLDQAIWYLLFASIPDEDFIDVCRDALFISVGNERWAQRVREAFRDVDRFNSEVLGSEPT